MTTSYTPRDEDSIADMLAPRPMPLVEVHYEVPPTKSDQRPYRTVIGRVALVDAGLVVVDRDVPTPKGVRTTEIPAARVIQIDHLPAPPDQTTQEG
ncbi:hypothetical protein [Tomitella gaofuii]|uniref:hypothetical protein n=1 Tax=Tomitella gaofuii TaxID=2760083 RepID=UPI0015F8D315|nr:hypothetical protein [Tomitella gaofuii]